MYRQRQRALAGFFGGACAACGYDRSVAALHVHHTDPKQKQRDFSARKWSPKDLRDPGFFAELASCELLCANCHAEHHDTLKEKELLGDF